MTGRFELGFDIGGTFTDFVLLDTATGQIRIGKCLTTPSDPSVGALEGAQRVLAERGLTLADLDRATHGTTLVANALIERRGAPTALLTTEGFRDILEILHGARYDLYNYFADKQELLAEALLRRFRHLFEGAATRIPQPGTGTVEDNLASLAATLFDLECEVIPMLAGLLADPPLFHRLFATLHEDPRGPEWFREPLAAYIEGERRLGRVRADIDPASVSLLAGATVMEIPSDHPAYGRVDGVWVSAVAPGSAAARYGLRADDLITGVNRQPIESVDDLTAALNDAQPPVALQVQREGRALFLLVR